MKEVCIVISLLCLLALPIGCSLGEKESEDDYKVHPSIDELVDDLHSSLLSFEDRATLEATVDLQIDLHDYIIGILYVSGGTDSTYEYYMFFDAEKVDQGFRLGTISEKISAESDGCMSMKFINDSYIVYFAFGEAKLPENVILQVNKTMSNGKNLQIAF